MRDYTSDTLRGMRPVEEWEEPAPNRGGSDDGRGRRHTQLWEQTLGRIRRIRKVSEWDEYGEQDEGQFQAGNWWDEPPEDYESAAPSRDERYVGSGGPAVRVAHNVRRTGAKAQASAGKRPRFLATTRSRVIAVVVCVILLLVGVSSSLYGVSAYQRMSSVAKQAVQHLTAAKSDLTALGQNPLDTVTIEHARGEFAAAHDDFVTLNQSLEAYSAAQIIPIAGGKVGGALRLAAIGVEGAQAGELGCEALELLASRVKDPFDPKAQGLTKSDITTLQGIVAQISPLFATITQQVNALQPGDLSLDSRLGPLVAEFRSQLPRITQAVADVRTLVGLAGSLLGVGAPAQYMLEVMDSTELRPGGGFIGNYGFLTLQGGKLAKQNPIQIQDVDLLDINVKYGDQYIPIPKQYSWYTAFTRWGFRDSNLDADFPTSAKNAEYLYTQEGGKVASVGVIAITPWLVQDALRIVGPVKIPELNTTVTADNLVQQIHYNQLTAGVAGGPDYILDPATGTSLRKRFSGLLFMHFLEQVKKTPPQRFSQLVHLLVDSLSTKDVQIYLNDPHAEAVLEHFHIASTIEAPKEGDSLLVVDTNMAGTKANYFIQQKMTDRVTLDATGAANHVTTLSYTFPTGPDVLKNTFSVTPRKYWSYTRVYVPPAAKLLSVSGWNAVAKTTAFGRQVWGSETRLTYGNTVTITLKWTLPGAAVKQGNLWTYDFMAQHQAGVTWNLDEQIQLPNCAKSITTTQPLKVAGKQSVAFSGPLSKDFQSSAQYTCP